MRAIRIRRSYIKIRRKKEKGKGDLRSLEESRKTKAYILRIFKFLRL
jgi:hypothetical protein